MRALGGRGGKWRSVRTLGGVGGGGKKEEVSEGV